MADLGNLSQYLDDHDISFTWKNKKYKIKPTAEQILDFQHRWAKVEDNKKGSDSALIWEHTAPLLGSKFNRETYRFEADDQPDGKHHGLILDLIDNGMDMDILSRLLSSVHAKYFFGDEVAEELAKTGDLGKALRNIRERNEENDAKATPKAPGETNADD